MATEVKVPTLGESVTEATVGQWLKKPGEAVKADEPIVSLETDKVAVDVPSPVAGVMGDLVAKEGDTVEVGALLAYVNEGGAAAAAPAAAAPAAKAEAAAPAPAASAPAASDDEEGGSLTLSPAVRRLVLEHGLDPSKIKGTGKDGRLTKDDVMAAVAAGTAKAAAATPASAPAADAPAAGPSRKQERVKMTRLRQTVAKRLKEAQNNAALLTTYNDVDMTNVIEARAKYKDLFEKKHGVRLGFMGFFTKAVCMALKDIPGVNAQIEGDEIVYNDFADISVAVSAPTGLVVPVIRNAESLSVAAIEKTIGGFGKKAKEGKLTMEDMKGGTFTISNGGVFGSLLSSPIINPPQSAVLGLHRIEDRPVVRNGQIVIRPMMYLALSYDHRLIDGREAVTFLVAVKNAIEDPTRLLIDL
ncbi:MULTISPECIES: 2-oxoglutarate dehydrogenase complex dihydrolipoyllysine-residue succinyltransferase [Sphingobium]|jgi:2-oxoglutarate dehydrogenase E2 component (dihydrolipoamide succinyltransferase)|uniref:Dihydrolipoyllysine-residue succinyltransferase component of 2-oxoglutarate dehydrogenase complex n=2 Tax=Sphingobium yanoikuyae TaxID=13690 RepID=A0A0J9D0S8_SPHYA|nr:MULTISPECIES: 2-oxoglutarate dehydrogenase complex dihydrolipoyllysine-residue succinyltransferase [Sphingobium]PZU69555.1 MAG: 2-oxoglutarate dehydrogenase complex dihydrolipoyllysine-residue succinyltransferase [Sphingobium sp.]ATI78978.1 dihydrolipoyllysine-residue succinyltransferase [Sphingobium yanoikuyae]ATP18645.1 dihydrolipoamide succinyltransferase [Sphingobium yanoikuyae]KMW30923.1 dihydrolipoamide succinyltransferase [Sphingobium yanoikuyae]OAH44039.1 dihydrolipoamide succinyltr